MVRRGHDPGSDPAPAPAVRRLPRPARRPPAHSARSCTRDGRRDLARANQPNPLFTCDAPINTGPAHFVLDAAFHRLDRWVSAGVLPPVASRLETTGMSAVTFAKDANGNVLGGIRTPAVDAPVATLSGSPTGGSQFCFLFGTTTPFTADQLAAHYPDHAAFVDASRAAADASHAAGFLVAADTRELIAASEASTLPA